MELIDTECVFHPPEPGSAPLPSGDYAYQRTSRDGSRFMPHIVIGDPTQRTALIDYSKSPPEITEPYLGVAFWDGDSAITPEQPLHIMMNLMYYPRLDYADAVEHSTFTLRVGLRIIGHGKILKRYAIADPEREPLA